MKISVSVGGQSSSLGETAVSDLEERLSRSLVRSVRRREVERAPAPAASASQDATPTDPPSSDTSPDAATVDDPSGPQSA